jgi:CBS domain-containing protein
MQLNDVLNIGKAKLVTVTPDTLLVEAAKSLQQNNIGVLVATNNVGDPVGIISERDVSRAVADNCDQNCDKLAVARVADYMSSNVVVCEITEKPETAIWLMAEYGIRHLPITNRGKLAGMVSSRDVMKAVADLPLFENKPDPELAITL